MKTKRTVTPLGVRFKEALKDLNKYVGKVGWFENNRYPSTGIPVAQAAATAEHGDAPKRVPARPIFDPTIRKNRTKWMNILKDQSKEILKGESTSHNAMEIIGLVAKGDIKERITEVTTPPLSKVTIAIRTRRYAKQNKPASSKPLVDTTQMLNTVVNVVTNK